MSIVPVLVPGNVFGEVVSNCFCHSVAFVKVECAKTVKIAKFARISTQACASFVTQDIVRY